VYDLATGHKYDEAVTLQYKLLRLFDAMIYSADFPEGVRAALRLRGFSTGAGRQPLAASQQVDLTVVSDRLQCLLAEEGFTHEPIGGCPTRTPQADPRQVDIIVRTVVAELQRRGLATE
jgi:4-hydroxy-tetrahydrodipicolinate synthase